MVNTKIRLIIFFAAKDGETLYSQQKQDQELTVAQIMNSFLIAKFRLKLRKVGKTTRPFRYDLNQISYDYTVEVRNRFKRLELIERLKNYGVMQLVMTFASPGFPDSSGGNESACNAGDPSSIPESERSAGEGVGYPLQYS